jgi:hypothetical protein
MPPSADVSSRPWVALSSVAPGVDELVVSPQQLIDYQGVHTL